MGSNFAAVFLLLLLLLLLLRQIIFEFGSPSLLEFRAEACAAAAHNGDRDLFFPVSTDTDTIMHFGISCPSFGRRLEL